MTTTTTETLLRGDKDDEQGVEWSAEIKAAREARRQAQERLKDRSEASYPRGMMRRPAT